MTLYPAGPLERAITLADLVPVKPAPGSPLKMILIGCLSALAGGVVMYYYMKKQTNSNKNDIQGDKA